MTNKEYEILGNIICGVETGSQIYANKNYSGYAAAYQNTPDEHTCTLGWCQQYGPRAKKLVQTIYDRDPASFAKYDTANIKSKLFTDWVATRWNPNASEKKALIAIISSPVGKICQDEIFYSDAKVEVQNAIDFGVTTVPEQMMWVEIAWLGGSSAAKRIFGKIAKPYTVDKIFSTLMMDQQDYSNNNQVGDKLYQSRHECCVKWIKQYVGTTTSSSNKNTGIDPIGQLIHVAENELGYLEKNSSANLDDKTANAGSGNYTKYWRDVYSAFQGQAWCACFVAWCMMNAFGLETAKKLLKHWPYVYCPTMASLFKLNANPKVGDIVIFYRNGEFVHTGIVVSVSGDQFTTIEGNTSNGTAIVANGGCVCRKSYYNSQLPGTKFCTPDYSIVNNVNITQKTTNTNILKIGSVGNDVKELQTMLNSLGYNCGSVDGEFGEMTKSALTSFQKDYQLIPDAEFGEQSRKKLEDALNEKNKTKMVKVTSNKLNIRYDPTTKSKVIGTITDHGVYTIVKEKDGFGLLKSYASSGHGWIMLKYTKQV